MDLSCSIQNYLLLGILLFSGCVHIGYNQAQQLQPDPNDDCPPLTISNHSAWSEFSPEGSDPILWQVFCTEQADGQLTGFWTFSSGPIGPHFATTESYSLDDSTCTNHSLQLFNVTFVSSAGLYTVSTESSCGSQTNQTFLLSVSGCPCGDTHTPVPYVGQIAKYVAVSYTPRDISLEAAFLGCADDQYYSVVVEHSAEVVCENNTSLSSDYECDQSVSNQCLFFQKIIIVDYSPEDSGDYCFSAVSVTERESCVHIEILPWPTVSGPSNNVTVKGTSVSATLQWTVHKFSTALNITAFKGRSEVVERRIEIVPDTDDAIVSIDVPIGEYQLRVDFSDSVVTSYTGFRPIWSFPGHVTFDSLYIIYLVAGFLGVFLIIAIIICCCKYHKHFIFWRGRKSTDTERAGPATPTISRPVEAYQPPASVCIRPVLSLHYPRQQTARQAGHDAFAGADEEEREIIIKEEIMPMNMPANCPDFVKPIVNIRINDHGGCYYNPLHGVTLRFPEGAIPVGAQLMVSIGMCLCTCGNFIFPEGLIPVSPIAWLCSNSQIVFRKPIEVIIPHFLECNGEEDAANLCMCFMKANHWDQAAERIQFLPTEKNTDFLSLPNKGIVHTNHFCFLCIGAPNLQEILARQRFCLTCAVPPTITSWSIINFYVTYFNDTCLRDMENKFPEGYSVREQRMFKFADVPQEVPAITGECSCSIAGRPVQVTRSLQKNKITMDSVNFWKLHEEGILESMHERKMYPPYMKLTFSELSLPEPFIVTMSFDGVQERSNCRIEIIVPRNVGVRSSSYSRTTTYQPAASDIPKLSQLRLLRTRASRPPIRLLETLAPKWEDLGDTIGFDDIGSNVQIIKRECEREGLVSCCRRVFQEWLSGKGGYQPPTWTNLIQILEDTDHLTLARAVCDSLS